MCTIVIKLLRHTSQVNGSNANLDPQDGIGIQYLSILMLEETLRGIYTIHANAIHHNCQPQRVLPPYLNNRNTPDTPS